MHTLAHTYTQVQWMYQKYQTTRDYMKSDTFPAPVVLVIFIVSTVGRFLYKHVTGSNM